MHMKRDSGENIVELANWFNLNIVIVFIPFLVINLMNCIIGYNIGLNDIIFDYAGLAYSTSVVLLVCLLDSIKRNGRLIVTHLLLQYAIISFVICMLIYTILNVCSSFFYELSNYDQIVWRIFVLLTLIMVVNILVIIVIKATEYSKNRYD